MVMVKRGFDVIPIGAQRIQQRFPGKRRRLDDDVPRCSEWRNNLTALAETRNLYVIAYTDELYIFEPQFPAQTLSQPRLIIPSRPSAPDLRGHLDPRRPNTINNLLVYYLGAEEVVATVHDDGDVNIFLIRHIAHAIDVRASVGMQLDLTADEIRPVFQRNVGASSWGLAIHREARVLAVSSNRHEVSIWRFGLVDESGNNKPRDLSRAFDAEERVLNGEANIPCIAFCNTADDPDARWLLTTDITGLYRTLDLHKMNFSYSFRFGRWQFENMYSPGYDRFNAGWTVLFLDPRSFANEHSFHDALGLQEHETLPDSRDSPQIFDLTRTVKTLPDLSTTFIEHGKPVDPRGTLDNPFTAIVTTTQPALENDRNGDTVTLTEQSADESTSHFADDDASSEDSARPAVVDDLEDPDYDGTEDSISVSSYYSGQRICANLPRFTRMGPFCAHLSCPVLVASVRNVYMLQPTNGVMDAPAALPYRPPFVGFAAPLRQSVQAEYLGLNMYERLNMSAYLPDLGLVLLASQKGRVLVLALTKLPRSVTYPRPYELLGQHTTYGLRIESILPTASQEKQNLRPFTALHGIAAAPMQGASDCVSQKKRWRLMLTYQDHTVLSYELARKPTLASDGLQAVVV